MNIHNVNSFFAQAFYIGIIYKIFHEIFSLVDNEINLKVTHHQLV